MIRIVSVSFERGQNRLRRRRFYPPSSYPRLPGFLVLLVGESLAVPTGGQAFAGCFGQSGRVWICPPQAGGFICTSGRGGGNHLRRRRFPPPLPGPPLYFPWLCVRRVYESACNTHCTLRVLAWLINGFVEIIISCHIYLFVCYKKCLSAADVWILAPNVGGALC